ncbi:hypothetical protein [Chitinophaga sp. LS1]|uniref:hypothetical protein n=1 Tax=Chitinophaga sp. LS1 TaxID=3051176 RepID=UPI002AAB9490|nr:hypothetical protein [Chitinophaga sp. LS1]WPV66326.1 hypothetical protein QQL36_31505 [Chitinophaga sp. LS1]
MKALILLLASLLFASCGKEELKLDLVEVKYVIVSNTKEPYNWIKYYEADESGYSKDKDWIIPGQVIGRFEKVVKVQNGQSAMLTVYNYQSGDFYILLFQGNERLDSIIGDRARPGTYYQATISQKIIKK